MTDKLHSVAEYFNKKYSEESYSNYSDIDWLKKLAEQMWHKRSEMEAAAKNPEDAFRVLRYLQSILSISTHLVKTAKTTGMVAASAKQYKNALTMALHGLVSVPGLELWNELFLSYNNSLADFNPRQFFPRKG